MSPVPKMWVVPPPKKTLIACVADLVASNDQGAELVTYSLGSCLGIAVHDPVRRVGGLLHIMLPDSGIDSAKALSSPCMFVDTGLPRLLQAVCSLGAEKSRLVFKVAGGAQFLDEQRVFNIGERNWLALQAWMSRYGLPIHAREVGGKISRTVRLDIAKGTFTIQTAGSPPYTL